MENSKIELAIISVAGTLLGVFLIVGAIFSGAILGMNDVPEWLSSYFGMESPSIQQTKQCPDPTCDRRSDYYVQCCAGELP